MPGSRTAKSSAGGTDWAALRAMPEEEIERIAAEDEDNPVTDEGHWVDAVVRTSNDKAAIRATFDREVVEFFQREGPDYAARMNAVLRGYMEAQQAKKAVR